MKNVCDKCGQCCKGTMGPFVFPSDVRSISIVLGIKPQEFLQKYCHKNIVVVDTKEIDIYSIKTKDSGCLFLLDNNLCRIYRDRPYQCKKAPYEFLAGYGLWNHMKCLDNELVKKADSTELDIQIFSELVNEGYEFMKGGE